MPGLPVAAVAARPVGLPRLHMRGRCGAYPGRGGGVMAKNKGVARAAKELRRLQAEERNAATPMERRRFWRDGAPEARTTETVPAPALALRVQPVILVKPRRQPVELVRVVHEVAADPESARARRRARYERATAPAAQRRTRASDAAPRRIGDGIKPNHAARAVPIGAVFLLAPTTVEAAASEEADDLEPLDLSPEADDASILHAESRFEAGRDD